jgi:hypothetical protein
LVLCQSVGADGPLWALSGAAAEKKAAANHIGADRVIALLLQLGRRAAASSSQTSYQAVSVAADRFTHFRTDAVAAPLATASSNVMRQSTWSDSICRYVTRGSSAKRTVSAPAPRVSTIVCRGRPLIEL